MKKKHPYYSFPLMVTISIFLYFGLVQAQDASPVAPPTWSVGDWWKVDCQVYDLGEIVPGSKPGWLPRQRWRFHVDDSDTIEGQRYFVTTVHPVDRNSCPYWFRYWFRESDRYVGRFELYHPKTAKTRDIGPPVVRKDFSPGGASPFFTSRFPAVPLTVPLFGAQIEGGGETISPNRVGIITSERSPYARSEFKTTQEISEGNRLDVLEKADRNVGGSLTGNDLVITIKTTSSLKEWQYWNMGLPWCVYGERTDGTIVYKRYWLVEMGRE